MTTFTHDAHFERRILEETSAPFRRIGLSLSNPIGCQTLVPTNEEFQRASLLAVNAVES